MERFEAFTGAILELSRDVQKLKELEMQSFGLRGSHAMCLYYLGKFSDGLTVTELAAACREDKAAVSRCIAQLTQRGLVEGNYPSDKRSYRTKLSLTEEGREMVQTIGRKIDSALTSGGMGLTEEQRQSLYQTLNIIAKNLTSYISAREEAQD